MAKSTNLYLPQNVNTSSYDYQNSDGSTAATIFTAGSDDSSVKSILVASTDTSARVLQLFVRRSSVDYLIGCVTIPIGAGTDGLNPAVDLLSTAMLTGLPIDEQGKPYLPLKSGDTLKAGTTATITSAKHIYINVFGFDF